MLPQFGHYYDLSMQDRGSQSKKIKNKIKYLHRLCPSSVNWVYKEYAEIRHPLLYEPIPLFMELKEKYPKPHSPCPVGWDRTGRTSRKHLRISIFLQHYLFWGSTPINICLASQPKCGFACKFLQLCIRTLNFILPSY